MTSVTENLPPSGETEEQRDIRMNKDVAAFSYVWIMSVVIFASRRDSKFVQYHSKQGIVLFIASIVAAIIPFVGKYLVMLVVAGMLLGFVNAAQGHFADVPLAGDLAKGKLSIGDLIHMTASGFRKIVDIVKKAFKRTTPPKDAGTAASQPPVPVPPVDK